MPSPDFRPHRRLGPRRRRLPHDAQRRAEAVRDLDRIAAARDEMDLELVVLGGPVLLVVIDFDLASQRDLRPAVRVRLELIVAGRGRHDLSLPSTTDLARLRLPRRFDHEGRRRFRSLDVRGLRCERSFAQAARVPGHVDQTLPARSARTARCRRTWTATCCPRAHRNRDSRRSSGRRRRCCAARGRNRSP